MRVAETQIWGDSGWSGKYVKRKVKLHRMCGGEFWPLSREQWEPRSVLAGGTGCLLHRTEVRNQDSEPELLLGVSCRIHNPGVWDLGMMGHREEEVGGSRTWLGGNIDHTCGHLGAEGERNERTRWVLCLDKSMVTKESDPGQNLLCHGSGLTPGKAWLGRPPGGSCLLHTTSRSQPLTPRCIDRFLSIHLHYSPRCLLLRRVSFDSVPSTLCPLLSSHCWLSVRIEEAQNGGWRGISWPQGWIFERKFAG